MKLEEKGKVKYKKKVGDSNKKGKASFSPFLRLFETEIRIYDPLESGAIPLAAFEEGVK